MIRKKQNINESIGITGSFWEKLQWDAANKGVPIHGHFELTPTCNLKCKMCYIQLEKSEEIKRNMLLLDDWKKIIDDAICEGMIFSSLTGGECLTNPLFKEIYLYLQSKGIMIFVLTNGVLLDKWIDFFVQNPPKLVQISMYGKDEDTYERVTGFRMHEKVRNNIELAIKNQIPICINITPSRYLTDVYDIAKYYMNKNVSVSLNQYLINPKKNTGRDINDFDLSIEERIRISTDFYKAINGVEPIRQRTKKILLEKKVENKFQNQGLKCAAGRSDFTISWDGKMYMCVAIDKVTGYPLTEGFLAAWKNTNEFAQSLYTPKECKRCNLNDICNLCPGQHYLENKEFKLNKNVCDETIMNLEYGIENL